MSEIQMPERGDPPAPPPAPTPPPDGDPRAGSLALGVALAWGINVVGSIVIFGVAMLLTGHSRSPSAPLFVLGWLPFLASVGLAAWMIVKGPRRTGIGIVIGIGSMWAVCLLLIAACFGIFFLGNWH
jgi:hypothetical protein